VKKLAYTKILFAVDGSVHMRAAGPAVGRLARATGAHLTVLHVLAESPDAAPTNPPEAPVEVERVVRQLGEYGVEVDLVTRAAPADRVAETIVAVARELGSDVIALGSRGLSDLSGLFRGSISHRVIAASDCPVLVVRYGVRRPSRPIHRILLAIAGGEEIPHALEAAITIARATGAEVLVLHARYLVTGIDNWPYLEPDEFAEQAVLTVVKRLEKAGLKAVTYSPLAVSGVAHEIAHAASAWEADLVIIGSRRLSELASLLLGGVDHQVLHLSDRPVLLAERPVAHAGAARTRK
jgi:nucleotide-binding universal stress UspA family protein